MLHLDAIEASGIIVFFRTAVSTIAMRISCVICSNLTFRKCYYLRNMNLTGNSILVTGGASGIGLALAKRFLEAETKRYLRPPRRQIVRGENNGPGLITRACDVGEARSREDMMRLDDRPIS